MCTCVYYMCALHVDTHVFPRQKSKHTESDKLSVQIQAYLDNVFDVGGLLEDAETKNAALEKVDELEEHLSHVSRHFGSTGAIRRRLLARPPRLASFVRYMSFAVVARMLLGGDFP